MIDTIEDQILELVVEFIKYHLKMEQEFKNGNGEIISNLNSLQSSKLDKSKINSKNSSNSIYLSSVNSMKTKKEKQQKKHQVHYDTPNNYIFDKTRANVRFQVNSS